MLANDNDSAINLDAGKSESPEPRPSLTDAHPPPTEPANADAGKLDTSAPRSSLTTPHRSPTEPAGAAHAPLTSEEQEAQNQQDQQAFQQAETSIAVDDFDDTVSDAGYDSASLQSASESLRSSVLDFAFENGRRYHKFREGIYNFPNEESEQDREDMKHTMMVKLCQVLHFAPIGDNPQQILDMGTGTGIWPMEMGDLFPSATVLGVDLSPIQPTWVPPNVKFMVDDVESPWLHPPDHFDYVHSRHTVMAIRNWPKLMRNVYHHLKPGGWYEMQEIYHFPQCHDGTMPHDHPTVRYWDLISEGLAALGVDFHKTLSLSDMMRDAGFVNVTERVFHIPIGMWPQNKVLKIVGLYWRTILMDGLQPIALGPLTRGLKWKKEQVDEWLVEVQKAYMDGWVHSHMPLHIIYGQRPGPGME
ncbi:MAG: hypothetical protein M1818_007410 [Claussenomyces sp. TS43310]|nr:MAG: hypothetical protein M1818_007410 [Claussenomyces sp. TS43310]